MIFQIVGYQRHVGKTSTAVSLIQEFKKRGFRVAAIKHSHKYDISQDTRGALDSKDTERYLDAGADVCGAITDKSLVLITPENSLNWALNMVAPFSDIVILEGFREERRPRIIVAESAEQFFELYIENLVVAVTGIITENENEKEKLKAAYPNIPIVSEAAELADLVLSRFVDEVINRLEKKTCAVCGYPNCEEYAKALIRGEAKLSACPQNAAQTVLYVNNKRIAINPFVQRIISATIQGMLSTLKNIDKLENISIHIKS
ncbi:MAG: molybdopterin-guanine dinucleotide biosynthesis protein B [Candidatus Freyarchaeota archaeon]|nr:molybdopterin-guanine dinucleotide biosynthesis protein B [Candidatus Jordarchaeia archaeon]MBS7269467.1 molybdopterin-guanine dinucleotide biosynthesis protein B [Candidatus Jordarchaeia archaeon]MBS7278764.1 molybdopterin-guanine dinucleotide biosynthesis protein B [Candidatus Jordarchaeia archaeon]